MTARHTIAAPAPRPTRASKPPAPAWTRAVIMLRPSKMVASEESRYEIGCWKITSRHSDLVLLAILGVLAHAAIDGEAGDAERQVGDANHQINAVVVSAGQIVDFFVGAGGRNRLLAQRARRRGRRNSEQQGN